MSQVTRGTFDESFRTLVESYKLTNHAASRTMATAENGGCIYRHVSLRGEIVIIPDGDQFEITRVYPKAEPADSGCYVDGHWGQYGIAHMIERATEFGYGDLPDQKELVDLAAKKLASMGPNVNNNPYPTESEEEALIYGSDEVEEWLNENIAGEGYSFYWNDGEFFYGNEDDDDE